MKKTGFQQIRTFHQMAGLLPVFLAVLCLSGQTQTVNVEGSIWNETLNEPASVSSVSLVRVGRRSSTEGQIENVTGEFHFLAVPLGFHYVIHTRFRDVPYLELLDLHEIPEGTEKVTTILRVFETTDNPFSVNVNVPHILIDVQPEEIFLRAVYQIENATPPLRTVASENGTFFFSIPEGFTPPETVSVRSLLDQWQTEHPIHDAKTGEYRLQTPLQPGVTSVRVEATLPFPLDSDEFRPDRIRIVHRFLYPIGPIHIITNPPTVVLRGERVQPTGTPMMGETGPRTWITGPYGPGETMEFLLDLSVWVPQATPGTHPREVRPNRMNRARPFTFGLLGIVLAGMLVWAARGIRSDLPDGPREKLRKLERLFLENRISEEDYWIHRTRLKQTIRDRLTDPRREKET